MSTFTSSMFQSIKDALATSDNKGSATFNEIMPTKVGNTYTVRLLPFAKDPSKTFFHYYKHGWNSYATGQYVQTLSPQTFGERDPIAEERFRVLRTGSEEEKEKMSAVRRLEKWLVNVYVIDDPSNPDNNGKVKPLPWEYKGKKAPAKLFYTIYNGQNPLLNIELRYKGSKTAEPQFQATATPLFKNLMKGT